MRRNYYSTFFNKNVGEHGEWVVIYAYGSDHENAMAQGFHLSDIQPIGGDGTFEFAEFTANQLNESEG